MKKETGSFEPRSELATTRVQAKCRGLRAIKASKSFEETLVEWRQLICDAERLSRSGGVLGGERLLLLAHIARNGVSFHIRREAEYQASLDASR